MRVHIKKIRDSLNGICQLCGRLSEETLHLDHDHQTEIARGFVCRICNNHVIPAAESRPDLVTRRVLEYLYNPPLAKHEIIILNKPWKNRQYSDPHFGSRHFDGIHWYKEFVYRDMHAASVYVDADKPYKCQITFVDNGKDAETVNGGLYDGEERLLQDVLYLVRTRNYKRRGKLLPLPPSPKQY